MRTSCFPSLLIGVVAFAAPSLAGLVPPVDGSVDDLIALDSYDTRHHNLASQSSRSKKPILANFPTRLPEKATMPSLERMRLNVRIDLLVHKKLATAPTPRTAKLS
jgi:hypothetical protein